MRFDFIDLNLFRHIVEAGSITHGAEFAGLALASGCLSSKKSSRLTAARFPSKAIRGKAQLLGSLFRQKVKTELTEIFRIADASPSIRN